MRLRSVAPPPAAMARAADPLAAAGNIAGRLQRDAVWYRNRCNWIGAERGRPAHRALGPALGDGTAGIALFFAQVHAATGDTGARRTALGAIGQALTAPPAAPGLYDGRLGVAYAAARCGLLLGDERLLARAARLARGRLAQPTTPDLYSGSAGMILALLALARLLGDDAIAVRARPLAGALAAWRPNAGATHALCGLAHGAAGIALALTQHGNPDGAERALAHERAWLDPDRGDWPDLRGVLRSEPRGSFRSPYPATWAHGAPGIALARLRAGDDRAAAIALATTAQRLEDDLRDHDADFTLAHGLAGRADVLLHGARVYPEGAALAARAGDVAAGRYAGRVEGWPCGVASTATPGLLDGHAGIGVFYLRLHDPAIPSPLLPAA
jgi:lantibiotic modifying enzyme